MDEIRLQRLSTLWEYGRLVDGIVMDGPWNADGKIMEYEWNSDGILKACGWNIGGLLRITEGTGVISKKKK